MTLSLQNVVGCQVRSLSCQGGGATPNASSQQTYALQLLHTAVEPAAASGAAIITSAGGSARLQEPLHQI